MPGMQAACLSVVEALAAVLIELKVVLMLLSSEQTACWMIWALTAGLT